MILVKILCILFLITNNYVNYYSFTLKKNELSENSCSFSSFNFFLGAQPGLYEIYCKAKNKRYIGEAGNVLDRLAKHNRLLITNTGECTELQLDWNKLGPDQFEARILFCGPEWSDRDKRLEKEKALIASYQSEEVYNEHPEDIKEKVENFRYVCEIKGVRYNSVYEASKKTGEKEKNIANKLKNGAKGYVIIEKVRTGYEEIIANGKRYASISEAVAAGEAKDRFQALRRLKAKKWKDWNYVSPDKRIDK